MAKKKIRRRPRGGASFSCQTNVRGQECGQPTQVLDTRRTEWGVRRQRQCTAGHVFVTDETKVRE